MARSITSGFQTEIEASSLSPILLVKAEFDSGDIRFWTGYGTLSFNSEDYTGSGNFLGITPVRETQDLVANKLQFTLTGINTSIISLALQEDFQNRYITLWFGVLDDSGNLISSPYQLFSGIMDTMNISDNAADASITITAESELVDFKLPRERKYTDEDQKAYYPDDKGLEFVAVIQDLSINWGVGQ